MKIISSAFSEENITPSKLFPTKCTAQAMGQKSFIPNKVSLVIVQFELTEFCLSSSFYTLDTVHLVHVYDRRLADQTKDLHRHTQRIFYIVNHPGTVVF